MTASIQTADVPVGHRIARELGGAYFADCYELPLAADDDATALELYLRIMQRTPAWIDALMYLRNRVVRLFGLKNLGALSAIAADKPASAYRVGDLLGIFRLRYLGDDEVILGDNDRHLDVQIAIYRRRSATQTYVGLATVVQRPNRLGRCYMALVTPMHRLIAPAMLRRAAHRA